MDSPDVKVTIRRSFPGNEEAAADANLRWCSSLVKMLELLERLEEAERESHDMERSNKGSLAGDRGAGAGRMVRPLAEGEKA